MKARSWTLDFWTSCVHNLNKLFQAYVVFWFNWWKNEQPLDQVVRKNSIHEFLFLKVYKKNASFITMPLATIETFGDYISYI